MAPALPIGPRLLFGLVEPALLIWAYITCMADPFAYYAAQAPNHPLLFSRAADFPPQAQGTTLQMANVLLLLAALGAICSFTPHARTAQLFLVAVAFADYGHIYGTYVAVGPELFWDPAKWNDMVAGSIGVSLFLNVFRWLTVLGVLGQVRDGYSLKVKKLQ